MTDQLTDNAPVPAPTPSDIPPPPVPPDDDECCHNGCGELCVFDIYQSQKADYNAKWGHVIDKMNENE